VDKTGDKFVTYIVAALFFSLLFVAATAGIHLMVRHYWFEILTALRGELGLDVSPSPRPAQARLVAVRSRAAA
jgi:hypothetical protein